MKESKIYTPSQILTQNLNENDLNFLGYLYNLCQKQEENIDIDAIDDNNEVVKKFFEPYVKEFSEHEYCFRRCVGEKELTQETQQFEDIPSGQYVLDTLIGKIDSVERYEFISPHEKRTYLFVIH